MSVDTPAQAGVSIDALLAAKEQRAARQADWLAHYQQPVISLTLVTPGAVKDSIRYRNMMGVALQACDQLLWKHRWQALDRQVLWLPTGPEALWCVAHPASEIKAMCSTLEQSHPLGRLWDIDVICHRTGRWDVSRWVSRSAAVCCVMSRRTPARAAVATTPISSWRALSR